jgi:hypothetical protein
MYCMLSVIQDCELYKLVNKRNGWAVLHSSEFGLCFSSFYNIIRLNISVLVINYNTWLTTSQALC